MKVNIDFIECNERSQPYSKQIWNTRWILNEYKLKLSMLPTEQIYNL